MMQIIFQIFSTIFDDASQNGLLYFFVIKSSTFDLYYFGRIMAWLYSLFIKLLRLGMEVFSLVNAKTKLGIDGRKKSLSLVTEKLSQQPVIWMHAASLGEYEQGLPVLQQLKMIYPDYKILVTFFSPSGYENIIKKNNQLADAICYLPFDERSSVKEFVDVFNPKIFFTVKYDYWYHLLAELKTRNCNIFVVSALFYENQVFFKTYGRWFIKQLKKNVDWIFHQTVNSSALAKSIGLSQSSVSGDTRFDRVKQILKRDNHIDFISQFLGDRRCVVFGSSWEAEEKMAQILHIKLPKTKLIIAPHDLKRVAVLQDLFPEAVLYSNLDENQPNAFHQQILIIDSIGLLSKLYSYADVAVVGGGFHSAGLHNILEAATFGVPVIFGNHYKKNPEADALVKADGGKHFDDEITAAGFVIELIKEDNRASETQTSYRDEMAHNASVFVKSQPDATANILQKIKELLPN